jgi:hypothetical protein
MIELKPRQCNGCGKVKDGLDYSNEALTHKFYCSQECHDMYCLRINQS